MMSITKKTIKRFFQKLQKQKDTPSLIIKKLTIVDKFLTWAYQKNLIEQDIFRQIKEEIDNIKSKVTLQFEKQKSKVEDEKLKQEYILTTESPKLTPSITDFEKAAYAGEKKTEGIFGEISLRFNLQTYKIKSFLFGWLKSLALLGGKKTTIKKKSKEESSTSGFDFASFGIHHYIGLLFFLIFLGFLGAGLYNRFFLKVERPLAYPINLTRGGRILSFQGRLTDSLGNPITTATNVQFKLYNVSTGGTPLYTAGPCSITPDQDGIFSTLIGSDCGSEIPNSVFTENPNVYLGVTVGADSEMTPRQPIANVGYAINAETLQGFPPGTSTSNIPFINQDGDLLISVATPGIRSTFASADFTLSSAKTTIIQSAGSGDVILQATGSGALKFRTGGSTDTFNRIIVDNTGNVGIGSSTPSEKLEVKGNIRLTDAWSNVYGESLKIWGSSNSNLILQPSDSTTGNVGIGTITPSYKLTVSGGDIYGSNNLYVAGNVGIGTTAPGAKLEVEQNLAGQAVVRIQNINTSGFSGIEYLDSAGNIDAYMGLESGGGGLRLNSLDGGTRFYISGSEKVRIDTSGNVGIGTTTPSQKLSVAGTLGILEGGASPQYYTIFQGGDQSGNITYTLPTSVVAGGFLTTDSSGVLSWTTTIPATSVAWSSITNPTNNLTLNHSTYTTTFNTGATTQTFFTINANSLTSGKGLFLSSTATGLTGNLAEFVLSGSNASNTGNVVRIAQTGTSSAAVPLMVTNLGTGLSFRVNDETGDNDTTPFVIDASGNVGIGTTGPQDKLDVAGFSRTLGIAVNNSSNTGNKRGVWLWSPTDSNHVIYSANPAGTSPAGNPAVAGFWDSGHRMRFRTYSSGQGFLWENSAEQRMMDLDADSGNLWIKGYLYSEGTGNNYFAGKVGIGTTGPGVKLHIWSNNESGIQIGQNTAGSLTLSTFGNYGGVLAVNARHSGGWAQINTSYASWLVDLGASNDFFRVIRAAPGTNPGSGNVLIHIANNGNVGIGTTAPGYKLDVQGGNARINNVFLGDVGHGSTWAGFSHSSSIGTNSYALLQSNNGLYTLINKKSGGGYIGFRVDNADKMVINDAGNVGIGTTTPIAPLHIGSSGRFNMAIGGGTYTEGHLYILTSRDVNTGVGFAAKVIGVNIQNDVGSGNEVYLRSNTGGLTTAGAIYLGADDVNQGIFGVLGAPNGSPPGTALSHYLTVRANGNVGIGTTGPNAKLDVRGNTILFGGTAYGDSALSIYGTSGNNDAAITMAKEDGTPNPVFSVLPWDSQIYISAGTYYSNGAWVQDSDNAYNQLFVLDPAGGARWYASNNAPTAWWGLANNEQLWNDYGRWTNLVESTRAGNSYFTGGNVGIGTTAPGAKLHVAALNDALLLRPTSMVAGQVTRIKFADPDGGTGPMSIEYWDDGSPDLAIMGGNVGIGTTSPSSFKLQVDGSIGPNANNAYNLGSSSLKWANLYVNNINVTNIYTNFTPGSVIFAGAGGQLSQNNSQFFWDTTNNRLGIGTNSFTAGDSTLKLEVAGSIYGDRFIDKNNTSYGLDPAGTSLGGNSLYIANGAILAAITGNVGIGTTAPGANLHIRGTTATNNVVQIWGASGGSGDYSTLELIKTADTNGNFIFRAYDAGGAAPNPKIAFGRWRSNPWDGVQMVLDTDTGNVGIGTTAPTRLLQVGTNDGIVQIGNVFSATISGDNGGHALFGTNIYVDSAGGLRTAGTHTSGYGYAGIHASWGNLNFYAATGNTTANAAVTPISRLFIQGSTGNVGIGTTGPVSKLQVVGAGGVGRSVMVDNREIKFRGDGVAHFSIYGPDTGKSYLTIQNTSAGGNPGVTGTDLFTITSGGNVGIGTTNPQNKLHIHGGQLAISGSGLDGSTYQRFVLYADTTNGLYFDAPKDSAGNRLPIQFNWRGGGTPPLYISGGTNYGNVGIGTTNPGAKLDVNGNIRIESPNFILYGGDNNWRLGRAWNSNLPFTISSWSGTYGNGVLTVNGVSYEGFAIGANGGLSIAEFRGDGQIFFRNNVGIGTTNPQRAKLVVGDSVVSPINSPWGGGANVHAFSIMAYDPTPPGTDKIFYNLQGTVKELGATSVAGYRIGVHGLLVKSDESDWYLGGAFGQQAGPYNRAYAVVGNVKSCPPGYTCYTGFFTGSGGNYNFVVENGNVGIGTTNPGTYKLYVVGTAYSTGGWQSSDIRLKKDISYLSEINILDKINNLDPIIFSWKRDKFPNKGLPEGRHIGLIAQQLQQEFPEVINYDNEGYLAVDYSAITAINLAAIKQQQLQIKSQSTRLSSLEKDLNLTSTGDLEIKRTDSNGEYVYDGNLEEIRNSKFEIRNSLGEVIERIGAFAEIVAAKIKVGLLEVEDAIINNVLLTKNIVAENLQSLTANVERLIASQKITSPVIETENVEFKNQNAKIKTTTESAILSIVDKNDQPIIEFQTDDKKTSITGDMEINSNQEKGKLAQIILKGLEGRTAVIIDASGNASFSGQISSSSIESDLGNLGNLKVNKDATISGHLTANILNITEASVSGKLVAKEVEAENINEIQRLLAEIKNQPLPDLNNQTNLNNTANLSDLTNLSNLTVTNQTNLYNVSVAGSLLVGQIYIEENSIVALASELKLSALDKIILFDGAVTIAKNGNITTKGTLIAQGGIKTKRIILPEDNPQLTIENSKGDVLASIDASGSAYFKNIALEKFTPATPEASIIAASKNFLKNGIFAPAIEASSSAAGTAVIPANSQEVLVYSSLAKPNSLIYLTPKTPQPISLSIFEKKDGYFRVIRNQLLDQDITFDWLIIN